MKAIRIENFEQQNIEGHIYPRFTFDAVYRVWSWKKFRFVEVKLPIISNNGHFYTNNSVVDEAPDYHRLLKLVGRELDRLLLEVLYQLDDVIEGRVDE